MQLSVISKGIVIRSTPRKVGARKTSSSSLCSSAHLTPYIPPPAATDMLSNLFRQHGQMCASRPWEVIIGTVTLTVCLLSVSLFAGQNSRICGWNHACNDADDDVKSSDTIILTITRCLAVIYVYLQFRNMRNLGSKYLLGIAGVFTIFASFVFSIAAVNLIGSDLTGLNEALPFFLLLVDLSKATALARFALSSSSKDEVVGNIGRGMAILGPTITLDALVETLVIGVGLISGVKRLEVMCCFGCLSVVANYLAFMTFYPACLAIVLQLARDRLKGRPCYQLEQLKQVLQDEEDAKPNPLIQRIKMIVSVGLVLVHAHTRWTNSNTTHNDIIEAASSVLQPTVPLWRFYMQKSMFPSMDYTVTLALAFVLAIKYIFIDEDNFDCGIDKKNQSSFPTSTGDEPITKPPISITKRVSPPTRPLVTTPLLKSQGTNKITKKESSSKDTVAVATKFLPHTPITPPANLVKKAAFNLGDFEEVSEDTKEISTQTDGNEDCGESIEMEITASKRSFQDTVNILNGDLGPEALTDNEIIVLVKNKMIPAYKLENILGNHQRGVNIRRKILSERLTNECSMQKLPYKHYDYKYVEGACCENVLGYVPIPVGFAGPLLMDGIEYNVPMATTEGCLIASTNRGCRALTASGGVRSCLTGNGMTRAPVVRFATATMACEAKQWLDKPDNLKIVQEQFNSTSRFAKLLRIQCVQASRNLYLRFVVFTGDAMGMNMVSKGAEKALRYLNEEHFPNMEILSLSGNFCTDKKPCAVNWILGRGKSVVCDAVIPGEIVRTTLKTTVSALVDLNQQKNLVGSAMAGSIGGFNAHAANTVTAIYLATGQDPAQNVCSSNCLTLMEATGDGGNDLYISCTMPSIEVGTIGGGTILPPQAACLDMLGVRGACHDNPGDNACTLARIICSTVVASELSLMSALAAGHLVKSHLKHNRSVLNMAPSNASFSLTSNPMSSVTLSSLASQTPMPSSGSSSNFIEFAPSVCTDKIL